MPSQTECKLQSVTKSPGAPLNEPLYSATGKEQTGKVGGHSADSPQPFGIKDNPSSYHERVRSGHPSTCIHPKPPRSDDGFKTSQLLRCSRTCWSIAMTLFAPCAAAHPLSVSEIASLAMRADGAGSEQLSNPHTWVIGVWALMLLVGLVWIAWVQSRNLAMKWRPHCLYGSGSLSLASSIAWTSILVSVDANDNRRYLALGAWFMFTMAFVSECHHGVQQPGQYFILVVPAFLMAFHLIQYFATQRFDSPAVQSWGIRTSYECVPLLYTLYAYGLYCIHTKAAPDGRRREEADDGTELPDIPASTGGGGDDNNPGDQPLD
jgi:hypothetical protein